MASGDFNFIDVVIGAPKDDVGAKDNGSIQVYSGNASSGYAKLFTKAGEKKADNLGFSVASGAEINGGGIPNLVASAPFNNAKGAGAGKVYVLSGKGPK